MTDTEILDWLEKHHEVKLEYVPAHEFVNPLTKKSCVIRAHWRRVFGRKDESNMFPTLRKAVEAQASGR